MESAASRSWGEKSSIRMYRTLFLLLLVVGSMADVKIVWELADVCNGLMALPNLAAILLLSPQVLKIWEKNKQHSLLEVESVLF